MYSERLSAPIPHTRAASAWTLCLLAASIAIGAGAQPLATQATNSHAESAASAPRALPPVEYDALLREAARLRGQRDFAGAAAAYARLAAAHPVDGDLWAALADTRRLSGDCAGALPAYRQALRLGSWREADHVLFGARCFAALGQADSALAWIRYGLFEQRSLWRRGLLPSSRPSPAPRPGIRSRGTTGGDTTWTT
jgi:tetratricopeptide (TPR) repeat protein